MSDNLTQHQTDGDHDRSRHLSMQSTDSHADIPGVQITRLLGTGAYGEVWVGIDKNTNRQVAVKFFHHQSGVDWQLLSKEVEKLVSLATQRYVVQLLDVGWDASPPYYVMEYLEDGSLDQFIKATDSISIQQAVELFHDITTGLTHAHNKGILHCDLKPANIILAVDGEPRITDFGLARDAEDDAERRPDDEIVKMGFGNTRWRSACQHDHVAPSQKYPRDIGQGIPANGERSDFEQNRVDCRISQCQHGKSSGVAGSSNEVISYHSRNRLLLWFSFKSSHAQKVMPVWFQE